VEQQGTLWDRERTIGERFSEYHARHPEVYELLLRFARELKARGMDRGAIEMLWQRVRWFCQVERDEAESDFKLNDHFRSRYVRMMIADHPEEFGGFFELRRLRAE
jgi:uncharacterized protein YicC (UPF0701 family)